MKLSLYIFLMQLLFCQLFAGIIIEDHLDKGSQPNGVPIGWRRYEQWNKSGTIQMLTEGNTHFVRLNDVTKDGEIGLSRTFKWKPNYYYRASADFRKVQGKGNDTFYFQITFHKENSGKQLRTRHVKPMPEDEKTFVNSYVDVQAPAEGVTGAVIYLYSSRIGEGALEMTNFTLEESEKPFAKKKIPGVDFGAVEIKSRELYIETDVTQAAIVYGNGQEMLAEKIQKAIEAKSGKKPELLPDTSLHTFHSLPSHCIMIGSRDSNMAIDQLYYMHHVLLDCTYPGKGGYVLRSSHNPLGGGKNVIFAGGSDEEGTIKAVDALIAKINQDGVKLGYLADIHTNIDFSFKTDIWKLPIWDKAFGWNRISKVLAMLYMTNEKKYADEFIRLAFPDEKAVKQLQADGEDYDDAHDPLVKPYHYRSIRMMLYWDMVEESPYFTEEQRVAVTKKFYDQLQFWHDFGYQGYIKLFNLTAPKTVMPDRHVQWEAVSLYVLARYFNTHYPCIDSRESLKVVSYVFEPLKHSAGMSIGTMEWYSTFIEAFVTYITLSGGREYKNSPYLDIYGKTLLMHTDMRQNDWVFSDAAPSMLGILADLLDDEAYAFWIRTMSKPAHAFRLGFSFYPTKKFSRNSIEESAGKFLHPMFDTNILQYPYLQPDMKNDEVTEFVSYRQKGNCTGDFLLYDTKYDVGGRNPFHNMNIVSFELNGEPILRGFANQILPLCDGIATNEKSYYAKVLQNGRFDSTAYIAARLNRFNGHDWTRVLVIKDNKFMIVADELTPNADTKASSFENSFCPVTNLTTDITEYGEYRLVTPYLPPATDVCPVSMNMTKVLEAVTYDNKRIGSYLKAAIFFAVPIGTRLELPFTIIDSSKLELTLHFLRFSGQQGALSFDLDGAPLPMEYRINSTGLAIDKISFGTHDLKAGQHKIGMTVKSPDENGKAMQLNLFGFTASKPGWTVPVQTIVIASAQGEPEIKGCNAKLGSAGNALVFNSTAPGKKGVPFYLESMVRQAPANNTQPVIAKETATGDTAILLPEPARLHREKNGGFTIKSQNWMFGYQVTDIDGKFASTKPFDFEYTPGKLIIRDADGNNATHNVTLVFNDKGITEAVASKPKQTSISLPDVPTLKTTWQDTSKGYLPISLSTLLPDNRIAIVSDAHIEIRDRSTGKQTATLDAPAQIGAIHYWEKAGLLVVGCKNEKIIAWKLDGTKAWEFTSEMAQELADSAKYYWFKSAIPGIYVIDSFEIVPGNSQLWVGSAGTIEVISQDGKLVTRMWDTWGAVTGFAFVPEGHGIPATVISERALGGFPYVYRTTYDSAKGQFNHYNGGMTDDAYQTNMGGFGFVSIGRIGLTATKLKKDEPLSLVGTFNGSMNRLALWDVKGKILKSIDFGPGFIASTPSFGKPALSTKNAIALCIDDLNGDGNNEIALATIRRNVILLDADFNISNLISLPTRPYVMKSLQAGNGRKLLAVGLKDIVLFYDSDAKLVAKCPISNIPLTIETFGSSAVVGTTTGMLYSFTLN